MKRVTLVLCNLALLVIVVEINCWSPSWTQQDPSQSCWYSGSIPLSKPLGFQFANWNAKNYKGNKELTSDGQLTVGLVLHNGGWDQGHYLCDKQFGFDSSGGTRTDSNQLYCIQCMIKPDYA